MSVQFPNILKKIGSKKFGCMIENDNNFSIPYLERGLPFMKNNGQPNHLPFKS